MRTHFTIACRGSKLSLAQADIFKRHVLQEFPRIHFKTQIVHTRGDLNPEVPINKLEGKDIFTHEVQLALKSGKADFAIHSMKDVSHLSFFGNHHTAVFDRGLVHDIAIFNADIEHKLERGLQVYIGTSSPRRAVLGVEFLKNTLPKRHPEMHIESKPIRGNVDTRLRKLDMGWYDGIILSLEGVNRLTRYGDHTNVIKRLLNRKKFMVLSLFHCPPAANQAALIAETHEKNTDAIKILNAINKPDLVKMTTKERQVVDRYGEQGCSQDFGTFSSAVRGINFTYAFGQDRHKQEFVHWDHPLPVNISPQDVFFFQEVSSETFNYSYLNIADARLEQPIYFISHKRARGSINQELLTSKSIWTSGTETWFDLAKAGIWVEGSADGLGIHGLDRIWLESFFDHTWENALILTNAKSALTYDASKITTSAYDLQPTFNTHVIDRLRKSRSIFWTSFQQYKYYQPYTAKDAVHMCAAGRTAELIRGANVSPFIFPTIKAFKQWQNTT